jgi:hypothetical protein
MDMFRYRKSDRFKTALIPLLLAAFILSMPPLAAQDSPFEEIVVNFDVPKLVNADISAQYDGQTLYLPLLEIFRLLEANSTHDQDARQIQGYICSPKDVFVVDVKQGTVKSLGLEFLLPQDGYLYNGYELYLRIDLLERYFKLTMQFDFSKLQVRLALNQDFPAYQKLKRKLAQQRLLAKKEESKEVYSVPFHREYLKGGVADWMISTNPLGNRRTHYFSLGLGGMLMGGDVTVSGTGDTRDGVDPKQLRYKWHYFVDDNHYLTQAELGEVFTGGMFSRRLDGLLLTNKPQVRRKYFQTIQLSGFLAEGWEVELYIDNRLTDYAYTDRTGEYNFNVDIYYGASSITMKMYGPNGEIKTEELDVKVPYNLIPKGEVEYATAIGKTDGQMESGIFGQANCFYGITSRLTAGVNVDIPVKADRSAMLGEEVSRPQFGGEVAFQPLANMTMTGFYAPGYAMQGGFSYTQPTVFNVNSQVTRYEPDPIRNPLNQIHNVNVAVSTPVRLWGRYLGLRCNLTHDRYPTSSHLGAHYGFSTSLSYFYANYIGRYKVSQYAEADRSIKTISSQLIIGARKTWLVRPQCRIDYDHTRNELVKYSILLTRQLFRTGQLSLSFERNEIAKSNLYMVTFNLFTGFADFNSRLVASSDQMAMTEAQHGSIRFNQESGNVTFSRRSGVGQCSAVLQPFVDGNFNNVYDDGEEQIPGLRAKIQGASSQPMGKDKSYYYDRLQPYDEYLVEIDQYSLDNPLLKPVHEGYRVHLNPNMVSVIPVPVVVVSEMSGLVERQSDVGRIGMGGIKVHVVNLVTGANSEITTFNNGEFYYLGLIPGKYRARVLQEQLDAYGCVSQPEMIDFEVKAVEDGSVVENINFLLIPRP